MQAKVLILSFVTFCQQSWQNVTKERDFLRGFGKVWYRNENVRQALGWATGPELPHMATVQLFQRGAVVWFRDTDFVYVFFTDREESEDPTEVTTSPRRTPPGQ